MRTSSRRGFTLVEILLVVTLLALLTMAFLPAYGWLRQRAGFAGCVSNLRIIHVGFNTYMQDHNMVWPQIPGGITAFTSEEQEWRWWFETLEEHGVARNHWICPSDKNVTDPDDPDHVKYDSSYVPTTFDELPNTAFRWKQPWVVERGGFHYKDKGPNLLMPDGTVTQGPAYLQ